MACSSPLQAYGGHVFWEFREVRDGVAGQWARLAERLAGRGVPSLDDAFRELQLEPVHGPLRAVFTDGGSRGPGWEARPAQLEDLETRFATFLAAVADATAVTGDPVGFLVSGATDYHRLDRALVAVSGKHLDEFERVLDWGVGCGRVARHFPASRAAALTGCDIDRDNVSWCTVHLPGTFVASQLTPPLPFGDATFDLVYGISVFTHFREPMQLRWLEELARVTASGAIVLLTTHGQTAIDFSRLPPAEYRRVQDEVLRGGHPRQRRQHATRRICGPCGRVRERLSQRGLRAADVGCFFTVPHILPGYILHHDLVILRKV